ncbi:MAG TPA: hypothetical protein VNU93_05380 [Verrucomicrobiae bacterium]|nr:hypothetical protein [Verrucomicrobiae bacterium]
MLAILTVTLGLAGLFGFLLGMYVFTYRLNLPDPVRWLGGVLGGLLMAVIMAGATLLMIWPPLNSLFILAGLVLFGITSAVILGRKPEPTLQCSLVGGEENAADVDTHGLDIDAGARL